jgi:hypothetical protein
LNTRANILIIPGIIEGDIGIFRPESERSPGDRMQLPDSDVILKRIASRDIRIWISFPDGVIYRPQAERENFRNGLP